MIGLLIGLLTVLVIKPTIKFTKDKNIVNELEQTYSNQHYFDNGYWRGMNDALAYMVEKNYIREDTTISIHLEDFIEMNNNHRDSLLNNK